MHLIMWFVSVVSGPDNSPELTHCSDQDREMFVLLMLSERIVRRAPYGGKDLAG